MSAPEKAAEEPFQELLAIAREQLRWTKVSALPQVRETLERVLQKTAQRRAYELCDGTRASNDVASAVGVAKSTVTGWTTTWRELGIAEEVKGRMIRHVVSLAAIGLDEEVDED